MDQPRNIRGGLAGLYLLLAPCAFGRSDFQRMDLHNLLGRGENESLLAWLVLGLLAGFIASKLVNRRGEGILLDILLGIFGALAGGWLFRFFGEPAVSGLNVYSLFVAVTGSVLLLVVYHALRGRRGYY